MSKSYRLQLNTHHNCIIHLGVPIEFSCQYIDNDSKVERMDNLISDPVSYGHQSIIDLGSIFTSNHAVDISNGQLYR